ncbi:MAG: hypothetical protein IPI63_11450 [Methanothrix sp.]|uniref:hypothetical protein n=1 Tax=Methanothrix sp. TaxID=90426 RepID=UPI0025D27EF9|nr:hypothetical protein [Methanothrix sp.]MBK7387287.1 hypothetical protein [Methanothrix sp.]
MSRGLFREGCPGRVCPPLSTGSWKSTHDQGEGKRIESEDGYGFGIKNRAF